MSSRKHQVRLDADVAEALGRDAERKGTSLNVTANTWLRRALGLPAVGTQAAARESAPTPANQSASLVPAQSTSSTRCTHPVGRRIGPYCAACNTKLSLPKGAKVQQRR